MFLATYINVYVLLCFRNDLILSLYSWSVPITLYTVKVYHVRCRLTIYRMFVKRSSVRVTFFFIVV